MGNKAAALFPIFIFKNMYLKTLKIAGALLFNYFEFIGDRSRFNINKVNTCL